MMLAIFHHLIQFSEVTHETWQRCACYTLHSTYNPLKNKATYILWAKSGWKYRVTVIESVSPFRHCPDFCGLTMFHVSWSGYGDMPEHLASHPRGWSIRYKYLLIKFWPYWPQRIQKILMGILWIILYVRQWLFDTQWYNAFGQYVVDRLKVSKAEFH